MQYRAFGKTNLNVSVLGFGGAPIGILQTDQERVGRVLNLLLDRGVNVIDTAATYQNSEKVIGNTIAHRRSDFILISKCGSAVGDIKGKNWSPAVITQSIERSLKLLRTDRLDVALLHSCDLETLRQGDALQALIDAREAGKVRFVGYSGDNEALAYAATLPDIAVIQTSVNIADQANLQYVLPVVKQHGQGVMAKRPLANVAWKNPNEQAEFYAQYAQPYHDRLNQMNLDPEALGLPTVPGADGWTELALRFAITSENVHTAIVGSTNPEHVAANLDIIEAGPLSNDLFDKVRDAFDRAQAASGELWPGLT